SNVRNHLFPSLLVIIRNGFMPAKPALQQPVISSTPDGLPKRIIWGMWHTVQAGNWSGTQKNCAPPMPPRQTSLFGGNTARAGNWFDGITDQIPHVFGIVIRLQDVNPGL